MPKKGTDFPETITIRVTKEQKKYLMNIKNYSELIRRSIKLWMKKKP